MNETARILIVDDDDDILDSMAELLCRSGYECHCARNAREAIAAFSAESYDLVIAERHIHGNEKMQLIHELAKIAKVPVILITGSPSIDSAMEWTHLPVVACMLKPLDLDDLLSKAEESIKRFRVSQTIQHPNSN